MAKAKPKFVRFIGDSWYHGKSVAVYALPDGEVRLVAETCGGKSLFAKKLKMGEYEKFMERCHEGLMPRDFNITRRALDFMGHP